MTRFHNTALRRPSRAMIGVFGPLLALAAFALCGAAGTAQDGAAGSDGTVSGGPVVVIAATRDDAALRTISAAFEHERGVRVRIALYDDAKPDALDATNADVLWSRDPIGVGALAEAGRLPAHASDSANAWDAALRDADGRWFVVATRARVFAYNTNYQPLIDFGRGEPPSLPTRIVDAWNPHFGRSQFIIAHYDSPSMRAHLASMRAMWDTYETRRWAFQMKRQLVRLVPNEEAGLKAVLNLTAMIVLADSDVVADAKARGEPFESIAIRHDRYDLRAELVSSHGPLLLPMIAARLDVGANEDNAGAFIDFALSTQAQALLEDAAAAGVFSANGAGGPELPVRVSVQDMITHAAEARELFRSAIID